jgi:hypothetical protein
LGGGVKDGFAIGIEVGFGPADTGGFHRPADFFPLGGGELAKERAPASDTRELPIRVPEIIAGPKSEKTIDIGAIINVVIAYFPSVNVIDRFVQNFLYVLVNLLRSRAENFIEALRQRLSGAVTHKMALPDGKGRREGRRERDGHQAEDLRHQHALLPGVDIQEDIPVKVPFKDDITRLEFRLFPIGISIGRKKDLGSLLPPEKDGMVPG